VVVVDVRAETERKVVAAGAWRSIYIGKGKQNYIMMK